MPRLPKLAIMLGLAGLLPFLGLGFAAILPDPSGRHVLGLVAYGGIILSFLGGVHWGFAVLHPAPLPAARLAGDWLAAERARLVGGIGASLWGWASILAALYLSPALALAMLAIGHAAMPVAEWRAARHGWLPGGYAWLRIALAAIATLVLAAACILRLIGAGH